MMQGCRPKMHGPPGPPPVKPRGDKLSQPAKSVVPPRCSRCEVHTPTAFFRACLNRHNAPGRASAGTPGPHAYCGKSLCLNRHNALGRASAGTPGPHAYCGKSLCLNRHNALGRASAMGPGPHASVGSTGCYPRSCDKSPLRTGLVPRRMRGVCAVAQTILV